MTIKEQLHRSAAHKRGLDPACPMCCENAPSEHLGELTYNTPTSRRTEPVWGNSAADVQARIDAAREAGGYGIRWSRNDNARMLVDAEDLKDLGA